MMRPPSPLQVTLARTENGWLPGFSITATETASVVAEAANDGTAKSKAGTTSIDVGSEAKDAEDAGAGGAGVRAGAGAGADDADAGAGVDDANAGAGVDDANAGAGVDDADAGAGTAARADDERQESAAADESEALSAASVAEAAFSERSGGWVPTRARTGSGGNGGSGGSVSSGGRAALRLRKLECREDGVAAAVCGPERASSFRTC